MLEARVRSLIALGRQVIVVGDMNVVHRPEDHGEGSLASKQNGFWDHPVSDETATLDLVPRNEAFIV